MRGPSPLRLSPLLALVFLAGGCGFFREVILSGITSEQILEEFNTSQPAKLEFRPLEEDVAELLHDALPDAYWTFHSEPPHPTDPATLLDPAFATAPVTVAIECVVTHPDPTGQRPCFDELFATMQLPPPTPLEQLTPERWRSELDVIRVQVNLRNAIRAIATFFSTTQAQPVSAARHRIADGVRRGLERFQAYQTARSLEVRRDERHPVSAMVMAGGAANGAFSAGATYWLLHRLDACKTADEQALAKCKADGCTEEQLRLLNEDSCLVDRLHMAAGASTGALITLLAKDYFVEAENRRQRALFTLLKSYSCSVNSDLYCVTDSNLKDLTSGTDTGLVRFDGLEKLIAGYADQYTLDSPTEYFTSTVDFRTGRTLHLSSRDPQDMDDVRDLRNAVLSSVVEPGLSEPVNEIGERTGVFIDGGVRSGLPLTTPLLRGAERAVVFVNAPLEPRPLQQPQKNGGEIALRMIDLFVHQPIVGELHEAEYRLAVKRLEEYDLCVERLQSLYPTREVTTDTGETVLAVGVAPQHIQDVCAQKLGPDDPHVRQPHDHSTHPHAGEEGGAEHPAVQVTPPGPPMNRNLARAYRPVWLFQPHEIPAQALAFEPGMKLEELSAAGYEFDPKMMWKLFVFGAAVAQQRCAEVSEVFGWHLEADGRHFCDGVKLAQVLGPARDAVRAMGCWRKRDRKRVCEARPAE